MIKAKNAPNPLIGLSILILLGFIWGTGYSIARFAMTNGVPPLGYGFWQSVGPALIIGMLSYAIYKPRRITKSDLRFYLITGLLGIAIPNTSMYFAASHLPAGMLALIVNTVPIVAYPLALFARLERFNWIRMLGIILAFCALMLIIIPTSSLPAPEMIPWVLATLITPFSFAICSIYIAENQPPESNVLVLATGMLIVSSILLFPLVCATHSFYSMHVPLTAPDKVILLEIVLSSIGYILFFQLIRIAGPVYYSLVDTIVVVTGLFWGYVIFNEHLNKWTATAVTLILFALILVTSQQRAAQQKEAAALGKND